MSSEFLSGVIEGFYGRPWTHEQRLELLPRLQQRGLNCYMYAPKDDIRLRARWRDLYGAAELSRLRELVTAAQANGLHFIYAIAPGLDMRYSEPTELQLLVNKVRQLEQVGVSDFVILFDDIPHQMRPTDEDRFGSFARAQAHVTEGLFELLRESSPGGRRLICPTDYCSRMAEADGWNYLGELSRHLSDDIGIFWTGEEIVSERLSAAQLKKFTEVTGRQPLIWDNLFANDYDHRRAYLGPLTGRTPDLTQASRGILCNPNCQFELNEVAYDTLAEFVRDPHGYEPVAAFQLALGRWQTRFGLEGSGEFTAGQLRLLAELFYLPWTEGSGVNARLRDAQHLLAAPPSMVDERVHKWQQFATDIAVMFERLTELRDRDLLYSLYNLVWEAREESRFLADYLRLRAETGVDHPSFGRPDHVANTYRLGFGARVHSLLPLTQDGRVERPRQEFTIRAYQPADRDSLYAVALATGHHGEDAAHLFADHSLLGHRYVGPYLDLEPGLSFVLSDATGPCGYVLGTADTTVFIRRFTQEWLPPLLKTLQEPAGDPAQWDEDTKLLHELFSPGFLTPLELPRYPAHLHIDLLPRAQGRGQGRRLIEHLLGELRRMRVPGVHLEVSADNIRAQGFYRAMGFKPLQAVEPTEGSVLLGRELP